MNSDKLNVLIISARADFGGGPEHILNLIKTLNKESNVFIACPKDYPYWQKFSDVAGISHLLEIPHRKFTPKALFALWWFVIKNDIHIIHSHGKGAGIFSRLLSALTLKSCIHTFHGVHIGNYVHVKKIIYIWIERILGLFTKTAISVSKSEYDLILNYKLISRRKLVLIPNGIQPGVNIVSDDKFFSNIKNVISISRNDYAKNPELLFEIMSRLNEIDNSGNYRLTLLGAGFKESEFEKKLSEYKLENYFDIAGTVCNPSDYLLNSFCYLSTSRSEGMPLAILESMSYGVPVVASNVQGNKDIVEHESTGFLYNISDPLEAARYISKLASDYMLWKKMSRNSSEVISRKYDIRNMVNEIRKEYILSLK